MTRIRKEEKEVEEEITYVKTGSVCVLEMRQQMQTIAL